MSKKDKERPQFDDDVEFIKPPNVLKTKVGNGGIPEHVIQRSEDVIQENDIDFVPFAVESLERIRRHLGELKKARADKTRRVAIDLIVQNIMQLKAHGAMFQYQCMSEIADVALKFMENIKAGNEDLYQIIEAHNNSIDLVIATKLTGDGGKQGAAIVKELREATQRYNKKYNH